MSHKASRTNKWGSMSQNRPPGPRAWSAHHHAGTLAPSGSATGKMCRSEEHGRENGKENGGPATLYDVWP